MSDKKDDLSQFSMLDLFRMEADSQTQILTDGLLAFERRNDPAAVESMMRAAHSIKGAASIVGLEMIVQLAHGMEDAFIAAQAGKLKLAPNRVDALLAAVDLIVQCSRVNDDLDAWLAANSAQVSKTMNDVQGIAFLPEPVVLPSAVAAPAPVPAAVTAPAVSPAAETPSDSAAEPAIPGRSLPPMKNAQNFDRLLALASEARINAHQLHPLIQGMQRYKRNQAALFAVLEDVMEAASHTSDPTLKEKALLAIQKSQPLKQFMLEHITDMENYERRLLTGSENMVDEVLSLRMRPFRDGIQHFPRMVRDLARSLGKDVVLLIDGEDTLVDRDILLRIESPLNHMLRNAVDHGMETTQERLAAGKPATGTIVMEARHRAGMLNIEISDDGRGVDPEKSAARSLSARWLPSRWWPPCRMRNCWNSCSCPPSA